MNSRTLYDCTGAVLIVVVAIIFMYRLSISHKCIPAISHIPDAPTWSQIPDFIPVWMFWDITPLPDIVQLVWNNWCYWCKESKHNFVPILVTNQSIGNFIDTSQHPCLDISTMLTSVLRSDFIRLALLCKYGGVYMDATVVITEPLDWIIGSNGTGNNFFQAIYNPRNMRIGCSVPVIENSFLAAPRNHKFVCQWFHQLMQIKECKETDMNMLTERVPKQANLGKTYHFTYHVMTKMLLETPMKNFGAYHIYDGIKQKYMNIHFNSVDDLVRNRRQPKFGSLLKLIGRERIALEKIVARNGVERGSFVDTFLIQMPYSNPHNQMPKS